jgi:hypothetical protein
VALFASACACSSLRGRFSRTPDGHGDAQLYQVFVEPPDLESFRRQARRFGFDEGAYLDAVKRVPVISREELERRLPFVRALAEMIGELGLARLKDRTMRGSVTGDAQGPDS